jgi:hypothetical protein
MAVTDDNGRISVSKDFLRAELAGMELRLVDKLATKSEVEDLRDEHDALRNEVETLKAWRQYTTGLTAGALGLAGAAIGFATHLF